MKTNYPKENSSGLESRSEQLSLEEGEELAAEGEKQACKGCELFFPEPELDHRMLCLLCAEDCDFEAGEEQE